MEKIKSEAIRMIKDFAYVFGKHDKETNGIPFRKESIMHAKECALIMIDEIIKSDKLFHMKDNYKSHYEAIRNEILKYKSD
jgi:hypothetical protein